jgi:S1-C subfamily serine protease
MSLDEDDDDFVPGPLLPPDDRLWRHPAELGAVAVAVAAGPNRPRRTATLAALSGLAGAVLAFTFAAGTSWFDGSDGSQRSLARTDPLAALDRLFGRSTPTDTAAAMGPAIVHVEVHIADTEVHGSGVMIRSTGEILTAAHLLAGATTVFVHEAGGSATAARIVGVDPVTDLALIDIDGDGFPVATLAWDPELAVGDRVLVVGRDYIDAQTSTTTVGSMNASLSAAWGTALHGLVRTASPARPGDAGAALVTPSGTLVGIVAVPVAGTGDPDAGAYAVAGDIAARVAAELRRDGQVGHAFLGIEGTDLTDGDRDRLGLASGALVVRALDGGPAAAAGLVADDVIVAVEGDPVDSVSTLVRALQLLRAGESVEVTYVRAGHRHRASVELGPRTAT